jgi:hypothetical protein
MAYPIIMPEIGFARPEIPFRKWVVGEDESAGLGQVISHAIAGFLKSSPIFACFHRFLVEEGESVGPGQVIAEVLVDGVTMSIANHGYGIVGSLVEMNDNDIVMPGDILANIVARSDRSARQKGLVPRPSTYQRWLRFGR